jgi:hypothetical protein
MKISQVNMDVESIVNKIKRGQIKLEAEFQRGEVWSPSKRKKMVDTILRGWPIPPVIFLKLKDEEFEILDGLQRITTINDFVKKQIRSPRIDGRIVPENKEILSLHNFTFRELENSSIVAHKNMANKIYSTPISIYIVESSEPEEIAELFNRFNSPLALNTVEKRNAYFGETRTQMLKLVDEFINQGASSDSLGFSNYRGAYEDVLLKVCYTIENHMVDQKISSEMLLNSYRYQETFSHEVIDKLIEKFIIFFNVNKTKSYKYSRATTFSLLVHLMTHKTKNERLSKILDFVAQPGFGEGQVLKEIYDEYTLYASTDVKSIKIRQYILMILSNQEMDFQKILQISNERSREDICSKAITYDYIDNEFTRQ